MACDAPRRRTATWPAEARSRVREFNPTVVNRQRYIQQLELPEEQAHHVRILAAFGHIGEALLEDPRLRTALVLEGDFDEDMPPARASAAALAAGRHFVKNERWSILRIGYAPLNWTRSGARWLQADGSCAQDCRCTRSEYAPWICSIRRPLSHVGDHPPCDLRSMVATAFHERAAMAVSSFARMWLSREAGLWPVPRYGFYTAVTIVRRSSLAWNLLRTRGSCFVACPQGTCCWGQQRVWWWKN